MKEIDSFHEYNQALIRLVDLIRKEEVSVSEKLEKEHLFTQIETYRVREKMSSVQIQ